MVQTLHITDIGAGGDGVARAENGEAVFVPYAAPGDIVEVDNAGKVLNLVTASPDRAVPPCRHFGICGGCALQHINEKTYQDFKKNTVLTLLEKAAVKAPESIEAHFIPAGTRRRANFAARITKGKAVIGFHERKSSIIRNVPDCLLITEDVRRVMEGMRLYLPAIAGEGAKIDVLIQCADGQAEVGLTGKIAPGWEAQQALSDAMARLNLCRISLRARDYEAYETLLEARPFYKTFGTLTVSLAPGAFLQPSAEGEAVLSTCVLRGLGDAKRVADLFCGNGTFTGLILEREIAAFDNARESILALKKAGVNARDRNLFKEPLRVEELNGYDAVILDPPRAGAQAQCAELAQSVVARIVYVSCNPQSFARDAAVLQATGYKLDMLSVVDQFTWSAHTEVVGVFVKI